jgi:hypothetical protein
MTVDKERTPVLAIGEGDGRQDNLKSFQSNESDSFS